MTDERLVDLETRFAYQDDALRVLSDTVARQQREIETLRLQLRELGDRVAGLDAAVPRGAPADERPPHY